MKPDWKDAPEWAEWLAMDANGIWYWYEREPTPHDLSESWKTINRAMIATRPGDGVWLESLEKRPETQP